MQSNTKFSIIVPVYNVEKYIEECVLSVVNQTYSNWELILVNDGSKDNSQKICEEFCAKDERIKLLNQENKGVSAARNLGLDNVTGDYIMFVDSDDLLEASTLEKLSGLGRYDVASFCWKKFYSGSDKAQTSGKVFDDGYAFGDKDEVYSSLLKSHVLGSACLKAIKTEVLNSENYKIRFDEQIKYFEDQIFCLQVFLKSNSGIFVDDSFYLYRARKSSAINSIRPKRIEDLFSYLECLQGFARSTGMSENEYKKLIAEKAINSYYGEIVAIINSSNDKATKQKIFEMLLNDMVLDLMQNYDGGAFFVKLKDSLVNKNLKKAVRLVKIREFVAKLAGKRKVDRKHFFE